ncbi:MAG: MFS transporter [Phenylobacterium sp.]|jgi:MFS family permease|uniref:MFS transporter n=1 Tax=Phenylobacterium sp. TaxID=1871053 RepID=UPI002A361BA3|nr:MFS transporter [Phenylobacterium sp.]MDX9997624.1 MFS transporter [Phenylobacterium sp.]
MVDDRDNGEAAGGGRLALAVLLLIVFMSLIGFGVVIPLLPFYAEVFDAAPWQVTLMFSVFSAGQFIGELTWGRLSDRIGRKPVLLLTIFTSGLGYVALAYAPGIWLAILARFVAGFFSGNISTIQGYIVDISPPSRLAGRLGLIGAAFGIGFVVGPALGGFLFIENAGEAGFRPPLLAATALCWMAGLGALAFVRESRGRSAATVPARPNPIAALTDALGSPVLRKILGTTFLGFLAFSSLWAVLGLWGAAKWGWGARQISQVISLTGVAAALAQGFFSGFVVRRIGETATIVGGLTITGIAVLVTALSGQTWLVVVALIAATAGHTMSQPATSALISHSAPPDKQGSTLGANNAAGSAARVLGPAIAGALFGLAIDAPFLFCALGMGPAAWLAWRAGRAVAAHRRSA